MEKIKGTPDMFPFVYQTEDGELFFNEREAITHSIYKEYYKLMENKIGSVLSMLPPYLTAFPSKQMKEAWYDCESEEDISYFCWVNVDTKEKIKLLKKAVNKKNAQKKIKEAGIYCILNASSDARNNERYVVPLNEMTNQIKELYASIGYDFTVEVEKEK